MNVLYLYNCTQTYTATVFEHLSAFSKHSRHHSFFAHQDEYSNLALNFSLFDAVVIHYTIRLPFDQIADQNGVLLSEYRGLKVLFIQDEYNHTYRAWYWIRRLGIQLVFTVVPQNEIRRVYPPQEFPGVRFVSVLTGYVPEDLPVGVCQPPSQRRLVVGYRGRPLPVQYGALGFEKIGIGELVAGYCQSHGISYDIEWTEEARIYGPKWYEFISSCRSMLGSESGSNVFDWDGTLTQKIQEFRARNPNGTDAQLYAELIRPLELPGLMNQVSPRIFEAVVSRTVLVLFEGSYSGVVSPYLHFIPVKKNGSNLDEVFRLLADGSYVDRMADRAYDDIIGSEKYSYPSFVRMVDEEFEISLATLRQQKTHIALSGSAHHIDQPTSITTSPIRAKLQQCSAGAASHATPNVRGSKDLARQIAIYIWAKLPVPIRLFLRPRLKSILRKG